MRQSPARYVSAGKITVLLKTGGPVKKNICHTDIETNAVSPVGKPFGTGPVRFKTGDIPVKHRCEPLLLIIALIHPHVKGRMVTEKMSNNA
jgi:hypothetical protein